MCCLPINQHEKNEDILASNQQRKSKEYQKGFLDGRNELPAEQGGLEYIEGYLEGLLEEDE
jgi:hypothetical protein